jgi:hypothetical protein
MMRRTGPFAWDVQEENFDGGVSLGKRIVLAFVVVPLGIHAIRALAHHFLWHVRCGHTSSISVTLTIHPLRKQRMAGGHASWRLS